MTAPKAVAPKAAATLRACLLCQTANLTPLVDVGPQPISNRFLRSAAEDDERFPIALLQCASCGLVQIDQPLPAGALVPPYDWITYNEPEGHLDGLVEILMGMPGIGPGSTAAGVSFKDDSTLARLARHGLKTWRLDLREDLGVQSAQGTEATQGTFSGYGVETIQDRLTPPVADSVISRRGRADVLLVRHILEHASEPLAFMNALSTLTKPGGYIVIEVPDCSRAMDACDYTTIWEEHTLYFTPATFEEGLSQGAFTLHRSENYPYPFENSLVAIASSNGHRAGSRLPQAALAREQQRGLAFSRGFAGYRERVRQVLSEHRKSRGSIALFGAGHLACTFVNVMGIEDVIDCVIDDNAHKQGLYMPGSKLPILGSPVLRERKISLCLLSLNPIGEQKVIANNRAYLDGGGAFASIFPGSAHALRL